MVRQRLGRIEGSPFAAGIQGIDLLGTVERRTLETWAQEGVDLIRAVPERLLRDLPRQLADVMEDGATWRTLRDELGKRLDIGRRHLDLIARDQVARLNSHVTESMHRAAGVTEYRWRANLDGRTRDTHAAANGLIVSWDSPGVPGAGFYGEAAHAGRAGQCRCTPEPVVRL